MAAWLVKTEPSTYSWDDLVRDGVAEWDGVMNAQAQINLRTMRVGDTCVVYHSMEQRAAVGLARVVKDPYPDPTDATGRRVWVDFQAVRPLERPVTLKELKANPGFTTSVLVKNSRLSVQPLTDDQFAIIEQLAREPA